jgi:hypothetical protein
MTRNLNSEQFQIPREHHDAIRAAIEHHGDQGITFSPTSTDYRDESGKVQRVPVNKTVGRYLSLDPMNPKGSAYVQTLPAESATSVLNVFNGHSNISKDVTIVDRLGAPHGSPGLAGQMRSAQLEAADNADKRAANMGFTGWNQFMDDSESTMRAHGDRSHIIHVTVDNKEHPYGSSDYEYDTKTGNIGPSRAFDLSKERPATVDRSPESGMGTRGKRAEPLRSFERD